MAFRGFMGWEREGRKSRGERQVNPKVSRLRTQVRPFCCLSSAQSRSLRAGHPKLSLDLAGAVTGPSRPCVTASRGHLMARAWPRNSARPKG